MQPGWNHWPGAILARGMCSGTSHFTTDVSDDLGRVQIQRRPPSPLAGLPLWWVFPSFCWFHTDRCGSCREALWMRRECCFNHHSYLLLLTHKLKSWGIITNRVFLWASKSGGKLLCCLNWLFFYHVEGEQDVIITEKRRQLQKIDCPGQWFDKKNKDVLLAGNI